MRPISKMIRSLCFFASMMALTLMTAYAQESKPESRFAKLDEMRVHYDNYGQGSEALIFVHGWSCNVKFWRTNIPAFTKGSRVIAIDLPGHGESDKPQTTYSIDLFARAIDAVMIDAKVERAVLIGHSMGTAVSRQFYRKYPAKTLALVVVAGTLKPFGTKEQLEPLLAQFRGPNYKKSMDAMVTFLVQSMKDPKLVEEIKTTMASTPQHVIVGAMDAMMDPAIWTPDKIKIPTLALVTKNERFFPPDYEKFVRELVPEVDYQTWEGVSHFLMMDEPQKFNDSVLLFLKKNKLIK
jgi:pimeloyl-ACP methyl ester carboxylesterase